MLSKKPFFLYATWLDRTGNLKEEDAPLKWEAISSTLGFAFASKQSPLIALQFVGNAELKMKQIRNFEITGSQKSYRLDSTPKCFRLIFSTHWGKNQLYIQEFDVWKMWILSKMGHWNCEFCQKWDSKCEFLDELRIFAPVCNKLSESIMLRILGLGKTLGRFWRWN